MRQPQLWPALVLLVALLASVVVVVPAGAVAPSPTLRAEILRDAPSVFRGIPARCGRVGIELAKHNHSWALLEANWASPMPRSCDVLAFNGVSVMHRVGPHHWREAAEGSEFIPAYACKSLLHESHMPRIVIHDLLGISC